MRSMAVTSKILLLVVILLVLYFVEMDFLLYARIQDHDVRPESNGTPYQSIVSCDINPLCYVTVKSLLLDYPNHFIFSPLAALTDNLLRISDSWTWVTPNIISGTHVFIAMAAGKCVSSSSLSHRRLGVILFQLRTWLDDMDGHVARKRFNITGERSVVGSTGYLVDGICDGLGCIALIIGVGVFLAKNPTRRAAYDKLQNIPIFSNSDKTHSNVKNPAFAKSITTMLFVASHLALSSIAWNRYISLYQDLLESDLDTPSTYIEALCARQTVVFRSNTFWILSLCWKLVNFHATLDYLLIAIFFDRIWKYAKSTRWLYFLVIILLVYVSESHYWRSYAYVHGVPTFLDDEPYSSVSTFAYR
ncbi:ceramide phosphoethanolamine synthase [Prorops nasuta]|uniref:ceramide phosphoethanolamine synthase n=1 Tax=Prorops nasuta TaxID=863751 RepID=UPI0034CF0978